MSESQTSSTQEWASGAEISSDELRELLEQLPFSAQFALIESPAEIRPVAVGDVDVQELAGQPELTEVRLFGDAGELRWRQPEEPEEEDTRYPVLVVASDRIERDGWDTMQLDEASERVLGLWKGAPLEGDEADREMNLTTDWDYPGVPAGKRAGLRVRTYPEAGITRFVRFEPMSDD